MYLWTVWISVPAELINATREVPGGHCNMGRGGEQVKRRIELIHSLWGWSVGAERWRRGILRAKDRHHDLGCIAKRLAMCHDPAGFSTSPEFRPRIHDGRHTGESKERSARRSSRRRCWCPTQDARAWQSSASHDPPCHYWELRAVHGDLDGTLCGQMAILDQSSAGSRDSSHACG